MLSPMTKRGNVCFSTIWTRKPSRWSSAPASVPAGPAPMIKTSVSVGSIIFGQAFLLHLFGLQQVRYFNYIIGEGAVTLQSGRNTPDEVIQFAIIGSHYLFFGRAQIRGLGEGNGFNGKQFPEQRQGSAGHLCGGKSHADDVLVIGVGRNRLDGSGGVK